MRLIPAFAFGEGMINLGSLTLLSNAEGASTEYLPFDLEITLAVIIYLACEFFLYFFILFLIEFIQNSENLMRCCFSSEAKIDDTKEITDSDVLLEQEKALKADPNDYEILTQNLRKVYMIDSEIGHKVAVDNLSFGVQRG